MVPHGRVHNMAATEDGRYNHPPSGMLTQTERCVTNSHEHRDIQTPTYQQENNQQIHTHIMHHKHTSHQIHAFTSSADTIGGVGIGFPVSTAANPFPTITQLTVNTTNNTTISAQHVLHMLDQAANGSLTLQQKIDTLQRILSQAESDQRRQLHAQSIAAERAEQQIQAVRQMKALQAELALKQIEHERLTQQLLQQQELMTRQNEEKLKQPPPQPSTAHLSHQYQGGRPRAYGSAPPAPASTPQPHRPPQHISPSVGQQLVRSTSAKAKHVSSSVAQPNVDSPAARARSAKEKRQAKKARVAPPTTGSSNVSAMQLDHSPLPPAASSERSSSAMQSHPFKDTGVDGFSPAFAFRDISGGRGQGDNSTHSSRSESTRSPGTFSCSPSERASPVPYALSRGSFSRIFLQNFFALETLSSYQADYEAGKVSHSALQQHVNWMSSHLDEDDRRTLIETFRSFNATPLAGASSSSVAAVVEAAEQDPQQTVSAPMEDDLMVSVPKVQPTLPQPAQQPLSMLPLHSELPSIRFTGAEGYPSLVDAAADELDGIARWTLTMVLPKDSKKRKPSNDLDADTGGALPSSDTDMDPPPSIEHTPGAEVPEDHKYPLHGVIRVNKAWMKLSGYDQEFMVNLTSAERSFILLRSDFVPAAHRILVYAQMHKISECKQFVVIVDKFGKEHYCLEHWRCAFDKVGTFLGIVNGLIELPSTQPIPPFIEGQQIDEATILYGFKRTPLDDQLPWRMKMKMKM